MQVIENLKVKEKIYLEKLENGLTVIIAPKPGIQKKYIIWGTHYGSNDSTFIVPGETEVTEVPKGVAHFLEHKLFEQENGTNSLDVLTALGVNANAYTTNDHTAYLYECTEHFYEALDEFMDYVQHPYFTEENVEKEKGIIGQEIMMYDDYPEWKVYLNALECMYHNNPIKLDITGSVETISHINPEILYKCYSTFYHPSNMVMVVCGDFKVEDLMVEIKKRLVIKESRAEIKRIYPEEPESIVKPNMEQSMGVSQPLYTIGIKDQVAPEKEKVKKHLAIQLLLYLLTGTSSHFYKTLYQEGNTYSVPSSDYEFGTNYAYVIISGQSNNPNRLYELLKEEIAKMKTEGVSKEAFERAQKMLYGSYVKEYDDVTNIARMFLSDYFKGINSFDYLETIFTLNVEYLEQVLQDVFKEQNMILSVVKSEN